MERLNKALSILPKTRNTSSDTPTWYNNAVNAKLPDDCRAKCDRCHGRGSHAGLALNTCASCHSATVPCELHVCWQCDGFGTVCPQCRGMRFVRAHEFDVHRGTSVEVIRCPVCCEGNNVNREREEMAIERYMVRWRTEHDRFKNTEQLRIATEPATARETRLSEGGAQ